MINFSVIMFVLYAKPVRSPTGLDYLPGADDTEADASWSDLSHSGESCLSSFFDFEFSLANKELFEGDLVVNRDKPPNLSNRIPTYGVVLNSTHPLVKQIPANQKITKTQKIESGQGEVYSSDVYVYWELSNSLEKVRRNQVALVDRQVRRGQMVLDKQGFRGMVKDWTINTTVQIGNQGYIQDVPINKLFAICPYVQGQEIMYKGHIGIITDTWQYLRFSLDSKSTLRIKTWKGRKHEKEGNSDPYFIPPEQCPGAGAKFAPFILRKAELVSNSCDKFFWKLPWSSYSFARKSFRVEHPQLIGVSVTWFSQNPFSKKLLHPPPPHHLDHLEVQNALPIGLPSSVTILSNSIRSYYVRRDEKYTESSVWLKEFRKRFVTLKQKSFSENCTPVPDQGVVASVRVALRQTMVNIEWENGNKEIMPACDIPHVVPLAENNHAGKIVESVFLQSDTVYGIVLLDWSNVDPKVVSVRWVSILENENGDGQDLFNKFRCTTRLATESIYDVRPHRKFSLCKRGTIVFLQHEFEGLKGGGTVVDLDLTEGKMLVASPTHQDSVPVWPHLARPLDKRCYWNKNLQCWNCIDLLPPNHQIELEFEVKRNEIVYQPISLIDANKLSEKHFLILDSAPKLHYFNSEAVPIGSTFYDSILDLQIYFHQMEEKVENIWIRAYENRMDLLSLMLQGSQGTPYEGALFLFDIQLPNDFPRVQAKIRYVSYSKSISPFIDHLDGQICTSKIETTWNPNSDSAVDSNPLIAFLEEIQSLLFQREPLLSANYVNRNDPEITERSRAYNEKIFINVLTSIYLMAQRPHEPWRGLIASKMLKILPAKLIFLRKVLAQHPSVFESIQFPLLPAKEAFQISLRLRISKFEELLLSLAKK